MSCGSSKSNTAVFYNALFEVPNPDHLLRISMTAQVHVLLGTAHDALTIPVAALGEQHYVDNVTPETSRSLLLRYRNIDINAQMNGVGDSLFQVHGMKMGHGIGIGIGGEVRRQAQVGVIDQNTRRKLFGTNPSPLGEVIGDMKSHNGWVPYTTASGQPFGQQYLGGLTRAGVRRPAAQCS
jgi:hypothetical protein